MDFRAKYIRLGLLMVIVFLLLALPWTYLKYELKKTKARRPATGFADNPVQSLPKDRVRKDIEEFLKKIYPHNPDHRARFLPRQVHAYEFLRQIQLNQEERRILSDLIDTFYPDFYLIQMKYQDYRRQKTGRPRN